MPPGSSSALQELAARIIVSTNGIVLTGCKLPGVGALTDELIVVASDALERAADAAPGARPTGKALERCLARLLAAALGSQVWLDDDTAGRPGKRLAKQAGKVRDKGVADASLAQQQRQVARAAAAADALLVDGLPARLAAIDATEATALAAPRQEVYNNFPEIAPEPPAAEEPPPDAAPAAVEPTPDESRWPRWLTRQLGRQGCAYVGAVEEKQRQKRLHFELERGETEWPAAVWPVLDWSKEGSPRELFLLGVVDELLGKLKSQDTTKVSTQKLHAKQMADLSERDWAEECVLGIEQQELKLECALAKYPRPIWVCACERVFEDECELCLKGLHKKEV